MDANTTFQNAVQPIVNALYLPSIENYYPIMDTPLVQQAGIEINGNFETNDNTDTGRLSYVTVLRDANALDPANGYGFAWMKGDGSIYNVYLVDNSPLADDLFVSNNFIVSLNGENTWKASTKVVISPNTLYNFQLIVGADYALTLYIWDASTSQPGTPTLYIGAPKAPLSANGTLFGIGVMGTMNCQWWYGDIVITSSSGIHTAVVYRLKARDTDFPVGSTASVNFYGYGVDGQAPNQLWGATLFINTYTNGVGDWVQLGTNAATNTTNHAVTLISEDIVVGPTYVSPDGFIDILATTSYATTDVTNLTTYYASLEAPVGSGIHSGGCADIYVNDSSNIVVAQQIVNNVTGTVALNTANGFLGPIHSIIDVQIAMVGDSFVPNQDWTLVSGDVSRAFSLYENPYIMFSPALSNYQVQITYRYYVTGSSMQTLISSDAYRYSGTSNLIKIMPPVLVSFDTLTFRGSISDTAIRTLLQNYVNGLTTTISLSEIINLLYSNGVTYIDIPNLYIGITSTDYMRNTQDEIQLVSTYTLSTLTAFYTDSNEMDGIARQ